MQQIITRKEAKEQGLKYYFTGKPCKYSHIADRLSCNGDCCECVRKRYEQNKESIAQGARKYRKENKAKIAELGRRYREQNKEKIAQLNRKYREQNKDKIAKQRRECSRKYYEQNRDEITERQRKYREQNKEKESERQCKYYEQNKEVIAEKKRKYRKENKEVIAERNRKYRKENKEQVFIRGSLRRILTNWKGGMADAEKLLGYTCEQLREHIESQFKDGMSWENRSEWHVDHKKPIKAFLDEGITDPAIVNALDNLQPLWAHENLSKGAKYDG